MWCAMVCRLVCTTSTRLCLNSSIACVHMCFQCTFSAALAHVQWPGLHYRRLTMSSTLIEHFGSQVSTHSTVDSVGSHLAIELHWIALADSKRDCESSRVELIVDHLLPNYKLGQH